MKILSKQDTMYITIMSNDKKYSKSIRIEWQDPVELGNEIRNLMWPISDQWSKNKSCIRIQENTAAEWKKYSFAINVWADVDAIYNRFIN